MDELLERTLRAQGRCIAVWTVLPHKQDCCRLKQKWADLFTRTLKYALRSNQHVFEGEMEQNPKPSVVTAEIKDRTVCNWYALVVPRSAGYE